MGISTALRLCCYCNVAASVRAYRCLWRQRREEPFCQEDNCWSPWNIKFRLRFAENVAHWSHSCPMTCFVFAFHVILISLGFHGKKGVKLYRTWHNLLFTANSLFLWKTACAAATCQLLCAKCNTFWLFRLSFPTLTAVQLCVAVNEWKQLTSHHNSPAHGIKQPTGAAAGFLCFNLCVFSQPCHLFLFTTNPFMRRKNGTVNTRSIHFYFFSSRDQWNIRKLVSSEAWSVDWYTAQPWFSGCLWTHSRDERYTLLSCHVFHRAWQRNSWRHTKAS